MDPYEQFAPPPAAAREDEGAPARAAMESTYRRRSPGMFIVYLYIYGLRY